MAKLLRADLSRMGKSAVFRACLVITLFASLVITYIVTRGTLPYDQIDWDHVILAFSAIPIFTSATFSALFIGEEHACGTIRNKLIIGQTRAGIYFSNLIVSVLGGLILAVFAELPPVTVALVAGSQCFVMGAESFLLGIFVCLCALISSCAISALIGILVTKKATSVTLALILMIGADAIAPEIKDKLDIPLTYTVTVWNDDGTVSRVYEEENPNAVTGGARVITETIYNIIPFGQIKLSQTDNEARPFLPLYSLGTAALITAAGVVKFRKKDLK